MHGKGEDMKRETIKRRICVKQEQLDALYEAYTTLIKGGVKSYAIGSRNLTRFDLPQIEESIKNLEDEIEELEKLLNGIKLRKAYQIIPRDL